MIVSTKVTAWSYSRLALFELCPAQFKYKNIDKLPDPPGPAMDRGNKVHKELADYLLRSGAPKPDVLKAGQKGAALAKQADELRAMDPSRRIVEQQWGFTAKFKPCAWFGKDTWWRVVLDVGAVYPDDTADVRDWKTGKKYDTNDDQMRQFALAVFKRFPSVKAVTTGLWYVDTGDEELAEFTKSDEPAIESDVKTRVHRMLTAETFSPRPNDKCRFCNFSKSKGGPCSFG